MENISNFDKEHIKNLTQRACDLSHQNGNNSCLILI